ncbi:MAG: thymidine kinase [Cytophagales bacterium]|nr:MAG: thymidine kinase [Cytophagales bacterium]TAF59656.1 MAG: thymidine kinase [Cytophagales bacterium]
MFLEPNLNTLKTEPKLGWIEVVCGSMFSGKTEELLRRAKRATIAKQSVAIFKPQIDVRYDAERVVSHDQKSVESIPVSHSSEILKHVGTAFVVGIDEAQFFDEQIVQVCEKLANSGRRVIVAGLDMDFMGRPFGQMPALMCIAEFVTKVHAICMRCGGVASHSYRLTDEQGQVLLGEKNEYEPRCRRCFQGSKK